MKIISKGQKISLDKEIGIKNFSINLRWDSNNYEIDSSALLLSQNGKMEKEENFVFYNNTSSPCNGVTLENVSNNSKNFKIDLNKISVDILRVLFILTIENQNFSQVRNISANIVDNSNTLLSFNVEDMTKETAIIVVEIYKHNGEWKLQATGNGFNSGLSAIIEQYGSDAVKVQDNQEQNTQANNSNISPQLGQNSFTPPKVITRELSNEDNQRINSIKQINSSSTKAQVVVALDLSYSMNMILKNGVLEDTFNRILPLAMQFDDDGQIDVFPFNDQAYNNKTPFNFDNKKTYLKDQILFKHYLGEAFYTPVIQNIIQKYSNAGKSSPPVYVIFITDGDCKDEQQAENILKQSTSLGIFWQFVGISEKLSRFGFLNRLDNLSGTNIDNVSFLHIADIERTTDSELYKGLLKEFPQWVQQAKQKGILK
ncbi:MAG: VWA domain-containing protein [Candidatus Sericytochromatia bacterium]